MIADKLLSRLNRVRPRGEGSSWTASCPTAAHARGDKNPSLLITESNDHVLLYCYSHRCSAEEIVEAVGLSLSDLFPDRPKDDRPRRDRYRYTTKPFVDARAVLESLAFEAQVVSLASQMVQQHYRNILDAVPENKLKEWDIALSAETHDRLVVAMNRIYAGWSLANGQQS